MERKRPVRTYSVGLCDCLWRGARRSKNIPKCLREEAKCCYHQRKATRVKGKKQWGKEELYLGPLHCFWRETLSSTTRCNSSLFMLSCWSRKHGGDMGNISLSSWVKTTWNQRPCNPSRVCWEWDFKPWLCKVAKTVELLSQPVVTANQRENEVWTLFSTLLRSLVLWSNPSVLCSLWLNYFTCKMDALHTSLFCFEVEISNNMCKAFRFIAHVKYYVCKALHTFTIFVKHCSIRTCPEHM